MRVMTKRMERASASSLSAAELCTIVRRLGYVAVKAHEACMANLIEAGNEELASAFNDAFKPVCDWLLHFELDRQLTLPDVEVNDGKTE